MSHPYRKDILRTIRKNAKRFFAIMTITALGLTAFLGITATCTNMFLSADRFYDRQSLFDIRVLATAGLTAEDVEIMRELPFIESAEGSFSEIANTTIGDSTATAEIISLEQMHTNLPYVSSGTLPTSSGEIAVSESYIRTSGKKLGDKVSIEEIFDDSEENDESDDQVSPAPANAEKDTDIAWDTDIEIEEIKESPNLLRTDFTITAVVISPLCTNGELGTILFRSGGTADHLFYVVGEDVRSTDPFADTENTPLFTAIHLRGTGLAPLDCYSAEYEVAVSEMIAHIEEHVLLSRRQARFEQIRDDALAKIADAEQTMADAFADADRKFADAWQDIRDAYQELADGESELSSEEKKAMEQLEDAWQQLSDARTQLERAKRDIASGWADWEKGLEDWNTGSARLSDERRLAEEGFAEAESLFAAKRKEIRAQRSTLSDALDRIQQPFGPYWPESEWNALVQAAAKSTLAQLQSHPDQDVDPMLVAAETLAEQNALTAVLSTLLAASPIPPQEAGELLSACVQTGIGLGIVEGGSEMLDAQESLFTLQKNEALAALESAEADLAAGKAALDEARAELSAGQATVEANLRDLEEAEEEFRREREEALGEIADAWAELEDGRAELRDGEAELVAKEAEYREQQAEARAKIADAYAEVEDLDLPTMYVQDRSALDSYSGLDNDMSSIYVVGQAFPVLFIIVAVLISLTTMTRMVEEERGLIGTYKAMGYKSFAIGGKYLSYAFAASLAGAVMGAFLGFVVLPEVLMVVVRIMYTFPEVITHVGMGSLIWGAGLFLVANVASTALACRRALRQTPAALMRPKTPPAGSRVLLERIPFVWNHLKFLNKVTARNLFRYKKRLFMTLVGIAGCTALVLTGFAIRDSVMSWVPRQYDSICQYDALLIADPMKDTYSDDMFTALEADPDIDAYLPIQMANVKVQNGHTESISVRMIVVPDDADLALFVRTDSPSGESLLLSDRGILLTENAAEILGVGDGTSISIQTLELEQFHVTVSGVLENYLGNDMYISQSLYESAVKPIQSNAAFINLAVEDAIAWADSYTQEDFILNSVAIESMKTEFIENFKILNYVISLFIILAAALAFVVLFTLANTNISERIRELASIKVLGFFDREVHAYMNKETLILTAIGVGGGLPLGILVSYLLLSVLKMPSLTFVLQIEPISFLFAAVISFSFALVVNLITDKILNRINMVEALKSVE